MTVAKAVDAVSSAAQTEHPFRGLTEGWRPVARASVRRGGDVQTCLEVVLDPERSAWVLQQAERAGLDFESFVKSLIDAARTGDAEST